MKNSYMNYSIKQVIFALILALFLILSCILLTVFIVPVYDLCIHLYDIGDIVDLSQSQLKETYYAMVDYLSIFYHQPLDLIHFPMSYNGRIHFEEVKVIVHYIQIIWLLLLLLSSYIMIQVKKGYFIFLKLTSRLCILIPFVIGFICMIDFSRAFVIFHELLFDNDYWIFDQSIDPVIQILPEGVFMINFMVIVILIGLSSFGCFKIYQYQKNKLGR